MTESENNIYLNRETIYPKPNWKAPSTEIYQPVFLSSVCTLMKEQDEKTRFKKGEKHASQNKSDEKDQRRAGTIRLAIQTCWRCDDGHDLKQRKEKDARKWKMSDTGGKLRDITKKWKRM